MLLRCKCPGCGDLKEYVAEEVGTATDCFRCGHRFTLQANPGRVAWHITCATLAVLLIIGGFSARYYWRAKRFEARHNQAVRAADQHRFVVTDDSDD
jgi:hypothetical protein